MQPLAICPIFPADCALPSAIVLTLNHTYLWDRALAVAHAFGCRSGLDLEEGYRAAGIEIKSSSVWREQYNRGLNTLLDAGEIRQAFGIYTGERAALWSGSSAALQGSVAFGMGRRVDRRVDCHGRMILALGSARCAAKGVRLMPFQGPVSLAGQSYRIVSKVLGVWLKDADLSKRSLISATMTCCDSCDIESETRTRCVIWCKRPL